MADKDDILLDFLDDFTSKKNDNVTQKPKLPSNESKKVVETIVPPSKVKGSIPSPKVIRDHSFDKDKYEEVVISDLPHSEFYHPGVKMFFRECTVKEIQRYSQLDESSIFDFKDKLNNIIESCVMYENSDGTLGSYEQILDGDRTWLIYLIREKTFTKGKVLSVKVSYKDGEETKSMNLELLRKNIEVWRDQEIMDYFDKDTRSIVLETELREEPFVVKPPTIGLKRCFDQYLKIQKENMVDINTTFYKIAPFLKPSISFMDWDELEDYQNWFEHTLKPEDFEFLFDLIENHLKIGIRGLKKNMDIGTIRSRKMYPNKLTTLFLFPNAFKSYIRKQTKSI